MCLLCSSILHDLLHAEYLLTYYQQPSSLPFYLVYLWNSNPIIHCWNSDRLLRAHYWDCCRPIIIQFQEKSKEPRTVFEEWPLEILPSSKLFRRSSPMVGFIHSRMFSHKWMDNILLSSYNYITIEIRIRSPSTRKRIRKETGI